MIWTPIIWNTEEFFWADRREYRDEYKIFVKFGYGIYRATKDSLQALGKMQTARDAHKYENKY